MSKCLTELLDNVIPGMSLTRGQFLRAMHRQNYIGQQLRGYRRRWHQEVFGAVVRESLRFDPFHRYTAEEMLEDFYQLQED